MGPGSKRKTREREIVFIFINGCCLRLCLSRAPRLKRWRGCPAWVSFSDDSSGTPASLRMVSPTSAWSRSTREHLGSHRNQKSPACKERSTRRPLCECLCLPSVCRLQSTALAAVFVGTVLRASSRRRRENSKPVDSGMIWSLFIQGLFSAYWSPGAATEPVVSWHKTWTSHMHEVLLVQLPMQM